MAATVGNLVIFLIGVAADASFVVMDRGDLHEVTVGGVIVATVPPLVVGTVLAALLARWWPAGGPGSSGWRRSSAGRSRCSPRRDL